MAHSEGAHPIAIVGGGPVGMMLALFLDRHGVPSIIFNLDDAPRAHPKGSTHNSRTMEHYRRLGIVDRIRDVGLPADHPTDVAYFTRYDGWELARLRMPSRYEKAAAVLASDTTSQIPEPIQRVNQMYVEQVLFDEVKRRPNIAIRFGHRVEAFAQNNNGVELTSRSVEGGQAETWYAPYLIGTDGGRSFVRRTLGIGYSAMEQLRQAFFGGRMVSTHLRAPTLYRDVLANRKAWQYWVVNPDLRTAMVALNGVDEFLIWTQTGDTDAMPSDHEVAKLVAQCAGRTVPVEVLAHRPWTAGVALVAERYGHGRVLLAGDSVHLFTPTGGFGMNTGVDDAANLAWKLAAMVQGWGGAGLLPTYEMERKPIGERNTAAARQLAKSVGQVAVCAHLEQPDAQGEAARADLGAHLATFGEEFASIGVQLGARYDGSPIIAENGAAPSDDLIRYTPSSVPGGRAPHLWLNGSRGFGASLFDRFGIGFTLLRLGDRPAPSGSLEDAAGRAGIPLTVLDIPGDMARDLYGRDLILVRPDQHVAWRGNAAPSDASRLFGRLTGH